MTMMAGKDGVAVAAGEVSEELGGGTSALRSRTLAAVAVVVVLGVLVLAVIFVAVDDGGMY